MVNTALLFYLHLLSLGCTQTRRISNFASTGHRVGSFHAGKRFASASKHQGTTIIHNRIELDSHADTIVCGSNCTILHYTDKVCDVSPYTDAYEAITSVPIVRAGTAWDNPDDGETFIFVFNEAIWMGDKMEHTLVNPNQLRSYGITVQDNPFSDAPLFIATETHELVIPLLCTGTIISANTRTPTEKELQTCRHIVLSSEHDWDPQNVKFPKASRTVAEEISRTIGAVSVDREDFSSNEYDETLL